MTFGNKSDDVRMMMMMMIIIKLILNIVLNSNDRYNHDKKKNKFKGL